VLQPFALTAAVRSWHSKNERLATVVLNLIIALVSWGIAELVVMPTAGGRTVTPIWPPIGIATAAIYIGGYCCRASSWVLSFC
jgi:hypothetical protein